LIAFPTRKVCFFNFVVVQDTQLTVNEFLTKLPMCVVRNGTILNIRDDIAEKFQV
jgi:hypothetical protein